MYCCFRTLKDKTSWHLRVASWNSSVPVPSESGQEIKVGWDYLIVYIPRMFCYTYRQRFYCPIARMGAPSERIISSPALPDVSGGTAVPEWLGDPEHGRMLLGGKAYGLLEMQRLGLSVPPFVTLTTEAWREYTDRGGSLAEETLRDMQDSIADLGSPGDGRFGDPQRPLFVSVRSGAPVSMPGAMETIKNVGLTTSTLPVLADAIGPEGAYEARVDLLEKLARFCYHIDGGVVDHIIMPGRRQPQPEDRVSILRAEIDVLLDQFSEEQRREIEDPVMQLQRAVYAVFDSWDSPAAAAARHQRDIPHSMGTAVTIQQMKFGNSSAEGSGSGVAFTHDPYTGGPTAVVFVPHVQGDRIVDESSDQAQTPLDKSGLPEPVRRQLAAAARTLETKFGWPQEIEFTCDNGLWFLQHRDVRLSDVAQLRYLMEQVAFRRMTEEQAIQRMPALRLQQVLEPGLDPKDVRKARKKGRLLGTGIPMTTGCATGTVVKNLSDAADPHQRYVFAPSVLTIGDMERVKSIPQIVGVVAPNGGAASHVGRVASAARVPCVFGVPIAAPSSPDGVVTIDGTTGHVFRGDIARRVKNGNSKMTKSEIATADRWLSRWQDNPWSLFADSRQHATWLSAADTMWDAAKETYRSSKARENVMLRLLPESIRIPYTPVSPDDPDIAQTITELLSRGSDVTVRTCHTPPKRGASPYFTITGTEGQTRFLGSTLAEWRRDPELTELIIGAIPKDKLNPAFEGHHCTYTVFPDASGTIRIQFHMGPKLRSHESGNVEEFITARAKQKPDGGLDFLSTQVGTAVMDRPDIIRFAGLVFDRLGEWWSTYDMSTRLAAVSEVIGRDGSYYPLALEGQARMDPDTIMQGGSLVWIKTYGLKIDPK
jgi:phosphohistidine swiveling domain-containing protein